MTLKGILWKPGVNGLGVGKAWMNKLLPYHKMFDKAARLHDFQYDWHGNGQDRKRSDRTFFDGMVAVADNVPQVVMACVYYLFVRAFGWAFYRYDKD